MFNIFKKKQAVELTEFLPVQIDLHSHILPGIDDGSPDMETSLSLIKGLYDLGIRRTIATPHIIGDLYRNTPAIIGDALTRTRKACLAANIDIDMHAAAEYMLDDYFMQLLDKKEPLLTIHSNIILTEQSYAMPNNNLEETTFKILTCGYQPIMAHPERYSFYHGDYKNYHRLKELGFLLQVNLLSLTGYYGPQVTKAAKYILQNKLASFLSTDLHHARHLAALGNKENLQLFKKYAGDMEFNSF